MRFGVPSFMAAGIVMYSFGYGGDIAEYFMRYRGGLRTAGDIPEHSGLSDGDRSALLGLYPPGP